MTFPAFLRCSRFAVAAMCITTFSAMAQEAAFPSRPIKKRVTALPDTPTIGETLQGFGQTPWYGMFAPAGTPPAVVARLQAAVALALDQPDLVAKLAAVGCEPFEGTAVRLATLVRTDLARWQRVVKDTGARVD